MRTRGRGVTVRDDAGGTFAAELERGVGVSRFGVFDSSVTGLRGVARADIRVGGMSASELARVRERVARVDDSGASGCKFGAVSRRRDRPDCRDDDIARVCDVEDENDGAKPRWSMRS